MTFSDYIKNPAGSKASVISNRVMYENLYNDKWSKLITRENGKIDYKLYMDNKENYVAHLKIPSETIDKFYYDVVIKFSDAAKVNTLGNAQVQFFSNDPSFNFTFAYAFHKKKLTIPELEKRMAKVALKKSPKEKNPDQTIGYVKTLYFAYIFMSERGLLNKSRFKNEANNLDWKMLNKLVEQTEDKIDARTNAVEKKEKEAKKKNDPIVTFGAKDIKSPEVRTQMFIGKTKRTSSIGRVKQSAVVHNKMSSIRKSKKSRKI